MATTLKSFTHNKARALPVILLADVSGSMSVNGKIQALNQAVSEMVATFAAEEEGRAEIQVAVITFGGTAQLHLPLQAASEVSWEAMGATGGTPMGRAMELAADLIDDREAIPSRAYRPTIVLVSDGMPTDSWEQGLARLTGEGRGAKAFRMALGIGADADEAMLARFVGGEEPTVYKAEDARRIRDFFQFLTMSVTSRSRSANPNAVPQVSDPFSLEF